MEKFMKVLDIDAGNEKEVSDCEKVFKLIDKDDDGKIDFPELMIFMFTIDEELSRWEVSVANSPERFTNCKIIEFKAEQPRLKKSFSQLAVVQTTMTPNMK